MTLYATGARRSELTHLKINDIDSQRMVVHIRGGKGRKDRDVMLSPKLLTALRTHWRFYHRKSSTWLFPSNYRKERPIDTKTVFGFLANRRRTTLLPLCFPLLAATPEPPAEEHPSSTEDPPDLYRCPQCGGPMKIIERLTAAEIQLRSPPELTAAA